MVISQNAKKQNKAIVGHTLHELRYGCQCQDSSKLITAPGARKYVLSNQVLITLYQFHWMLKCLGKLIV